MRYHFGAINMGRGDESAKEVELLVERLRKAFSIHSGLQQGQGSLSKEVMNIAIEEISDTVHDIALALGARENFDLN
jgi:hypothetical protein